MTQPAGALAATLAKIERSRHGRTLGERAFEVLHEAIVTGLLMPGQRLPIEEVAEGLAMSPMPVREALSRLNDGGLVDLVPHRGATVTDLSLQDLRDLYASRLVLEPIAVARAARRFTPEDAERAARALESHNQAYEQGTPVEAFTAHTAFHVTLYRASSSRWLVRLINPLWESSQRYRLALPPAYRRRLHERRDEHERILAACVDHDPQRAAIELYNHLVKTANRIGARLGQQPLFDAIDEDCLAPLTPFVLARGGDLALPAAEPSRGLAETGLVGLQD